MTIEPQIFRNDKHSSKTSSWLIKPLIWHILMEKWSQNCICYYFWSCCDLDLQASNFQTDEHTCKKFCNMSFETSNMARLDGIMTPKLRFVPYLVILWPLLFTFKPKIFRNDSNSSKRSFSLIKSLTWHILMEKWPQNCIFFHIWSCCHLDLWPRNLQF